MRFTSAMQTRMYPVCPDPSSWWVLNQLLKTRFPSPRGFVTRAYYSRSTLRYDTETTNEGRSLTRCITRRVMTRGRARARARTHRTPNPSPAAAWRLRGETDGSRPVDVSPPAAARATWRHDDGRPGIDRVITRTQPLTMVQYGVFDRPCRRKRVEGKDLRAIIDGMGMAYSTDRDP